MELGGEASLQAAETATAIARVACGLASGLAGCVARRLAGVAIVAAVHAGFQFVEHAHVARVARTLAAAFAATSVIEHPGKLRFPGVRTSAAITWIAATSRGRCRGRSWRGRGRIGPRKPGSRYQQKSSIHFRTSLWDELGQRPWPL